MDASVYSEAKGEYTKQLTLFIVPAFHRFYMELLQQATTEETQSKRQLWKFQELLSQIPEWNIDKVQREINKLIGDIQCDYLEELLTAVFIAHTKVLTAIRVGNKNKRVQITIPKLDHFLHRALSECSRLLWTSAYLFQSEISPIEKQKNHRQIEQLLHEGIAQAIRGLLPVKNILKDYLTEPENDPDTDAEADAEDDEEEEQVKKSDEKAPELPVQETPVEIPITESVPEPVQETPSTETPVQEPSSDVKQIITSESHEPIQLINIHSEPNESIKEESALPVIKEEPPKEEPVVTAPVPPVIKEETTTQPSEPPTLYVDTETSVGFTDFDQIIQQKGNKTYIDYIEKDRDDIEDEAIGVVEDDVLFEEVAQLEVSEASLDNSAHNILHAQIDPIEWKTELERVGPKLAKFSQQTFSNEWRSHVDQTTSSKNQIEKVLGETQGDLLSMNRNVGDEINRIKTKEKYMNHQFAALSTEHQEVTPLSLP
jgi:hypothetical protein